MTFSVQRSATGKWMQIMVTTPTSIKQFQELCQRAGNLWPDAAPELKTFIDEITEGKEQQDYRSMEYYKTARQRYVHEHCCPECKQITKVDSFDSTPPTYHITCMNERTITIPPAGIVPEGTLPITKTIICRTTRPFTPIDPHTTPLESGDHS